MATTTTAISAKGRVRSMKDGIHESFAAQGWNCPNQRKKQTNADRIRSMSDEELAEFLCKVKSDYQWLEHEFPSEEESGEWEEWLKSEVEE